MDEQTMQLLIKSVDEAKAFAKTAAEGVSRIELASAQVGADARLKTLEEFKKKWEPVFYEVVGGGIIVVAMIDLIFRFFSK